MEENKKIIEQAERIISSIEVNVFSINKIINDDIYNSIKVVELTNLPKDKSDVIFLFKSIKSIFKNDGFLKKFDSDKKIVVEYYLIQDRFRPSHPLLSESIHFDLMQKPSLDLLVKKTFLKNLKKDMIEVPDYPFA